MPGPWRVVGTDSESLDGVASCPLHEAGPHDACDACSVIETHSEWVASYAALLSPVVGLALADALDQVAGDFGSGTSEEFQRLMLEAGEHGHPEHPLLVAARLILGGSS